MKKLQQLPTGWWVALMGCALFLSFAFARRFAREEQSRVDRLSTTLQELKSLDMQSKDQLGQLADEVQGQVTDPKEVFSSWSGKGVLFFSEVERIDLKEGYRRHKVTLSVERLPAEDVTRLIQSAENASPPWRVTSIQLGVSSGVLKGELLLEALDKAPPEL